MELRLLLLLVGLGAPEDVPGTAGVEQGLLLAGVVGRIQGPAGGTSQRL